MVVDTRRCIGCQACTIACKTENEVPLGVWRTTTRYYEKGRFPRVKRHFFPILCDHCNEAPCVEASENNGAGSFHKTDDGMVLIDYGKLKGRSKAQIKTETDAAIESCPLDVVFANPNTGLPEKCTFCAHRVAKGITPACCQTCLGRARQFGDLSDPDSAVSKRMAANASRTLMPDDDGGGSGVFYIGLEGGHTDYGALEGGVQVTGEDFDTDKISQTTSPKFQGWTPETKVGM
jgi:tetrathionate reductase subunit B